MVTVCSVGSRDPVVTVCLPLPDGVPGVHAVRGPERLRGGPLRAMEGGSGGTCDLTDGLIVEGLV